MSLLTTPYAKLFVVGDASAEKDARQLRQHAVRCGAIAPDWPFLVTPLGFAEDEFVRLLEHLRLLENLIFDLPNRLFAGSYRQFFESVGVEPEIAEWLALTHARPCRVPARWDLIPDASGWKVLELNLGACLGGINFSLLRSCYQTLESCAISPSSAAWPDALQLLIEHIRRHHPHLGSGARVALLEDDALLAEYGYFLESLGSYFATHSPFRVSVGPASRVHFDGTTVCYAGEPLDAFVGMFTIREMFAHRERHAPLLKGVEQGKLTNIISLAAESAFGVKSVLAMLSEPANWSVFRHDEVAAIAALVPWTRLLVPGLAAEVRARQARLVLKPCDDYGGSGVICGWEHSADVFAQAMGSGRRYVVQERVSAESVALTVSTPDGRLHSGVGCPVVGLFTIDGEPAGGLVRSYLGEGAPGVVNAHRGAAVGVALLPR